ncbi:MAG: hypothetical protein MR316_03570 [Lachnospiraceae bacterium]|nr:hypothetical protein [Lachnospiraceae bacterium]
MKMQGTDLSIEKEKNKKKRLKKQRKRMDKQLADRHRKRKEVARWEKLDNTANLFPAIATPSMTNVYRISVTMTEPVQVKPLQKALDEILPCFDSFRVRMRRGIFWNYFETNYKMPPLIEEETDYPCRYMEAYENNGYLFRVSYYQKRINLEVFHVLADGMGAMNFLRELVYRYLQILHPEQTFSEQEGLSDAAFLGTEDSYLKNYKRSHAKGYKTARAVEIKGEHLPLGELGVIHGTMSLQQLKQVCKTRKVSINEYFTAVLVDSIYREYLKEMPSKRPIAIAVPVNLRPYFESVTTRNFFVMVSALFQADRTGYTFEEILQIVVKSLREQITKEHLEELFSYNVSNQKNLLLRSVPMFIKIQAMRFVYRSSARANTTTLTNIGNFQVADEYAPYIEDFHGMIAMSTGQHVKMLVCSYQDHMNVNFSSSLRDVSIQRRFFRKLVEEGIEVTISTNGVYDN